MYLYYKSMHANEFGGKKHTDNHSRVFRCLLVFYASDISEIFFLNLWTLPLEIPRLPTFVASLNPPSISGLGGLSGWHSTKASGMPFFIAILAMHLSVGSLVIEVTLVAFR